MRSRLTACLRVKAARTSSSPPPEKVVLSPRNSGFPKADAPPSRPHLPPAPPGPARPISSPPRRPPIVPSGSHRAQIPSSRLERLPITQPHSGWTPHSRFRAIKGLGPLPPSQQVKLRRREGDREGPRAPPGKGSGGGPGGAHHTQPSLAVRPRPAPTPQVLITMPEPPSHPRHPARGRPRGSYYREARRAGRGGPGLGERWGDVKGPGCC